MRCHPAREANAHLCSKQNDGAVGFSAPTGEIPQAACPAGEPLKRSGFPEIPALSGWRRSCPLRSGEHHVFRAALFSIVLTLAVGQNASLLCQVWCHDATSAGCPHQDSTTSPSVSADDNCRSASSGRSRLFAKTRGAPLLLRTRRTPSLFLGSDWPLRLLTCALASSRGGGCRSKNDLSLSPSESKSPRRSRLQTTVPRGAIL